MPHPFPLEIVEKIINHLHGEEYQLRACALVSVAWADATQPVLFQHIDLSSYSRMTSLLPHLKSSPHLPKLIRSLIIYQHPRPYEEDVPRNSYMTCLTAILTLLPHIMSLTVDFRDYMWEEECNLPFVDLLQSFLPRTPLLMLDLVSLGHVEDFEPIFTLLKGTGIRRIRIHGYNFVQGPEALVEVDRSVLQLPLVECIRIEMRGHEQRFHYWFSQRRASFPNLNRFEIFMAQAHDLARWCDLLQMGFPSVKECRFEVPYDFYDEDDYTGIPEEAAYCALPLGSLHIQHLQFGVASARFKSTEIEKLSKKRKIVEWWACVFSTLAHDKATIHFTELTFPFTDVLRQTSILPAWESLDQVLSQKFFSRVERVHFETKAGCIITDSDAAARIRVAMPQLASRNVLCFS